MTGSNPNSRLLYSGICCSEAFSVENMTRFHAFFQEAGRSYSQWSQRSSCELSAKPLQPAGTAEVVRSDATQGKMRTQTWSSKTQGTV